LVQSQHAFSAIEGLEDVSEQGPAGKRLVDGFVERVACCADSEEDATVAFDRGHASWLKLYRHSYRLKIRKQANQPR
jgi:hypothetical protein